MNSNNGVFLNRKGDFVMHGGPFLFAKVTQYFPLDRHGFADVEGGERFYFNLWYFRFLTLGEHGVIFTKVPPKILPRVDDQIVIVRATDGPEVGQCWRVSKWCYRGNFDAVVQEHAELRRRHADKSYSEEECEECLGVRVHHCPGGQTDDSEEGFEGHKSKVRWVSGRLTYEQRCRRSGKH